ncbi:MAG: class I tRNA ligase family protein, partial [Patescibacteria group bacterium]
DDLSTWYIRRSRERFKGDNLFDKADAKVTTQFVLEELSKLLAPFTPFIAEDIYQKVKGLEGKESVHLEDWPKEGRVDEGIIESMKEARRIVSFGLEARAKVFVSVRQPLSSATLRSEALKNKKEFLPLILLELNVKEIRFNSKQTEEISLDTAITPELKEEGNRRNLVRFLQDIRKKQNLNPQDRITLVVHTNKEGQGFIERSKTEMMRIAGITSVSYKETEGETFTLDNVSFTFNLIK